LPARRPNPVTLPADDHWPTLLLAFRTWPGDGGALLNRANSPNAPCRSALPDGRASPSTAIPRRRAAIGAKSSTRVPPALIEFAAASNELARLGA
jgi:hypothetical protein